ncbi:MAG: TolC family protein [Vicinamibacterales bacterium]
MRRLVGVLLTGLLFAASEVRAQEPVLKLVTFDQAVAEAVAENPTVARAATAINRAEAVLSQARSVTRPTVNSTIVSSTVDTAVSFDDNVIQPQSQVTFGADIGMAILAPARWAQMAQARDQVEVATESAADVRRQIGVAAAQTWLMVLASQRQVGVEERALETARAHLQYAQRRFDAGAGSRLNMVRAAQEVSTDEARLEVTRLALRAAQEALGVLLAENGPVDITGEPSLAVPATIDESAWMAARSDLRTQNTIVRASERIVNDNWKDFGPSANLSFNPAYVTPSGLFQPSRSWRLTVSFVQPIFLGGLRSAVSREKQSLLTSERLALTELELQARSEVRLAQATVASRERALTSIRTAAEQANEVLKITTVAFEVGATTNIEVIDAQRSARDAETIAAVALDGLERARLDLLVAIGQFPK